MKDRTMKFLHDQIRDDIKAEEHSVSKIILVSVGMISLPLIGMVIAA